MSPYSIIAKNTVSVWMPLFFFNEEGGEVGCYNELALKVKWPFCLFMI